MYICYIGVVFPSASGLDAGFEYVRREHRILRNKSPLGQIPRYIILCLAFFVARTVHWVTRALLSPSKGLMRIVKDCVFQLRVF